MGFIWVGCEHISKFTANKCHAYLHIWVGGANAEVDQPPRNRVKKKRDASNCVFEWDMLIGPDAILPEWNNHAFLIR